MERTRFQCFQAGLLHSFIQEAQRDIDEHAATVAAVLNLCDVLARDVDACGSQAERDALLQTAGSLERRWRNIGAASLDRRIRSDRVPRRAPF